MNGIKYIIILISAVNTINAGTEYLKSNVVYQLLVCYHSVASSAYIFQSTFQKLDNGSALWLNHNLENISMYLQN